MEFDIEQTDELLSTTRAVRRRLDFDKQVPNELLARCIELAEQAPTGAGVSSRRWMIVKDPAIKSQLAELYRDAGGRRTIEGLQQRRSAGGAQARMAESSAHLATNLEKAPAIVLVTIWGVHDGSGRPGLFDSVIQAAWSFCLALRARGLGSAWTTMHLGKAKEIADLLGIPDGVTQIVLLPVAWTIGTDFKPAPRRKASEIIWFDQWGDTQENPGQSNSLIAAGPGISVEIDIAAPPEQVWEFVSDINIPARFSDEFQGADWVDTDGPHEGASFIGRNERKEAGRVWQTTSYVVVCDPPRIFAWHVNDRDQPSARWRFELEPIPGGTRLSQRLVIGPSLSATGRAMEANPEQARQILANRREQHRGNMILNLEGIKRLAESGA